MDRDVLAATVVAARAGDADAFAVLVREFQPLAAATAFGWTRDTETAREICQEAFTDAWRRFDQLDDPRAFPAWFRSIVVKHCDRRTRRAEHVVTHLDAFDVATDEPGPAAVVERADEFGRLRLAIEALPRDERVVIALSYLADRTESDVAAWLGLPIGTVKTRMHRARTRLRREMHTMASETVRRLKPELLDEDLTDVVRFYIAVRAGDTAAVAALARQNPALVDAPESWDVDLTYRGVLPIATRATPLVRAVERNDLAMVETLLELGADPNDRCGCNTLEPPLWTAVLTGRLEIARALLDAGAQSTLAAFSGQTPLHVAFNRGDEQMAKLLLEYTGTVLETGIKAIDLFVPIEPGDRVLVIAEPGVGSTVLLCELSYRYLARGLPVTWTGHVPPPLDERDVAGGLAEAGLADRVVLALSDAARPTVADGIAFVFAAPGHEADTDLLVRELGDRRPAVTTFVVRPFNETPAGPSELKEPWDACLAFDRRLAQRGVFPAIDGARSASRVRSADPRHDRVARDAAAALADLDSPCGAAIRDFLAQPFFTTQPFSGYAGDYVPLQETTERVTDLLSEGA